MASEYRRLSVNTSLRDARIFADDSSSADDSFPKIKEEPLDDDEDSETYDTYYSDNAISLSINSKDGSRQFASVIKDEYSSVNTDSPIKQERIDFEMKLKFEPDDSTTGLLCPPAPIISDKILDCSETESKINVRCPPAPEISVKRNLLKRRNADVERNVSESESDVGVSPVKKMYFGNAMDKTKNKKTKKRELETDPDVLRRRQKQIDYGKNTVGYERYLESIPRNKRGPNDPQTPDKFRKYSRRGWDGLIKQWRIRLHRFDPDEDKNNDQNEEVDIKTEEFD